MSRKIEDIVNCLRRDVANPSVSTTLIQTEDLLKLCDAVDVAKDAADNYVAAIANERQIDVDTVRADPVVAGWYRVLED